MARTKKSEQDKWIDGLLQEQSAEELLKDLTAAVMNRALNAELTEHLDYDEGEPPPLEQMNRRNGHRKKQVRTSRGKVEVHVPRDRDGTYKPQLIKRYQRAIPGFDDKLLGLYARGVSTRDIRGFFQEEYGVNVSPELVSRVTDAVVDELKEWQDRPLQSVYPIVYLDALVVKVREDGPVENKSLYLAIGVDEDGKREVLGLWLQRTEGAKFWMSVLQELRHRGVDDVLILCADGLTGLPDAVEAVFPKTTFQTCVVHLIRSSTRLVPWKERKAVCADLKLLYTAPSLDAAERALDVFEKKHGKRYPMVVRAWRERFEEWTPFLAYSPKLRRAVYTTNVIEATHRELRKVLKTKGHLPSDEAVKKLVYLVIRRQKNRAVHGWSEVRLELAIHFEGRFVMN